MSKQSDGIFSGSGDAPQQPVRHSRNAKHPSGGVTDAQRFDRAYHLSRSHDVQRAREIGDGALRKKRLIALASKNIVDGWIDIDGSDPLVTMQQRQDEGYQWVPSYGQNPVNPPTYPPGPAGSIVVSTDAADYQPVLPLRNFGIKQHREVVTWLSEIDESDLMPAPVEYHMCLPGSMSAENATQADLVNITDVDKGFDWAPVHFAIGIALTGKLFDSEELAIHIWPEGEAGNVDLEYADSIARVRTYVQTRGR